MDLDPELTAQLRRVLASLEQLLPKPVARIDWNSSHAANWRRHSFAGYLESIATIEDIHLEDLFGIDNQKKLLEDNTRQFLAGYPANNVLLWGTRGTGKSSLVRALLHRYAPRGLRVIQVDKTDLIHLPDIVDEIKNQPYKFIIFSDDLSFEIGESSYKMLKSALDGSVYAPPENVLIYVTSNRRHLLPEYESDHLGGKYVRGELQQSEAMEEKVSLSDRFGIWVGFYAFSQDRYLDAVRLNVAREARERKVEIPWTKELERDAIQWSHDKSKRCGRTAYQFSKNWIGHYLLATNAV